MYYNVVNHNQAKTIRDDWTDKKKKHITKPPYYTHVQQNKQVFIVIADAVLTQTLTMIPHPDFSAEFLSILINRQSSRFNCSPESRLAYINELINGCEFSKT